MKIYKSTLLLLLLSAAVSCASKDAEIRPPASSKEILKTTTSWDGDSINYPAGPPEITGLIIDMEEGFDTGFHCHPVPNLAYMLDGEIEVEVFEGPIRIFKKGDAFEEVINTWHKGRVINGPAQILVFYVGELNTPITIKPQTDDLKNLKCIK